MAIDTVRIKDLEEVSVNDLANMWMVVDSGTPDSTNKVKLSALAGYIGGQADGRYIPLAGSSEITGSLLPKADKVIALGSGSFRWSALYSGEVHASDVLAIPTAAPSDPLPGEVYLYSGTGSYSETPGGGGGGDVYKLTLRKGSTSLGVYDPAGPQDQTIDIAAAFSGYLTSVPAASSSDYGGFKYGDPIDTMLVMNDGYLAVDLVSLAATTQSIVDAAVADLTPKVQAIPYIVGPDSDATAGTWHGTYEGITALTEGLTIVYVPHVAGATTTTLNINGLGAKTCYWTGTSKMTTQYPVGTPILLTYHNNGWRRADANTTYSAGTKALFDAGTNTSNRVWSAKILADSVAPIVHEHDWSDINNAPAFITADALSGYATETYVGNQIAALNLGTASQKNYTTSVVQNGTDLPTSGAVYSAIAAAVTSALHYRGMSSTALTDGGTETATIGGQPLVAQSGDVVIYNGFEFLWENNVWNKLGDDSSYALKTVQISAGTGLTGGGDLTTSRTIGLSTSTQTDIGKGVTAYGWGDHSSQGYLKSSDHKALTLKVGTATVQSDYTSLAAKTYTITKQHITDAIGNTTYAAYNANGYLPLSGGTLSGALTITAGGLAVQGGDLTAENNIWAVGNITAEGKIAAWGALAIPTTAPSAGLIESGEVYLYASSLGSYSETPGDGGTGDIYALTITKNGSAWLSYNPGVAAVSANLTIGWSDLTPDANHRFLTDTLISTWNGKQDAISDLSTIRTNAGHGNTAYGWGDHSQAGYLTSYTETDPVFSASAAAGITSSNISTWNGKYTKPSTGIPKTDLASAVQTTLTNADTAYGWGNHASAGYLTSSSLDGYVNEIATGTGNYISGVSKSGKKLTFTYGTLPTTIAWTNVTGRPTALSDLTNDIISDWALATSKPTYSLSEITGADDLKAIEAITGTSGLLKKTAANTWSLDTNTYLTSSSHKALTLKVGTTTIGSDYTSLAAKTYTISKQNLTDTIGSTTYAAYNASGYLPLSGGTLTGALTGTSATFTSGSITDLAVSSKLAIPTSAPSNPVSGKIYLYASSLGEYAVEPWYGFNQLVQNGDFASTSGWSMPYSGPTRTVANNILTLTCGTSNNYRPQVYHTISVAANHKIYYTYTIKITTSSPASQRNAFLYSSSGSQYIPTTYSSDSAFADWKKVSAIVTTTRAYTRIYIGRIAGASAPLNQGDTVQIKNVMIIDLTEMFGENIPTVEQFEAMYPQEYYDYTPIGG